MAPGVLEELSAAIHFRRRCELYLQDLQKDVVRMMLELERAREREASADRAFQAAVEQLRNREGTQT